MKRYGADWQDDGEYWRATISGRYEAITWKFGDIHQCIVEVAYKPGKRDGHVQINLPPQETRDAAMRRSVRWVEEYQATPAPVPDEVFARAFHDYPTIYRTRLDVIDHIFFCIGNGYDWLDGAAISTDQSDDAEREEERARWREQDERTKKLRAVVREFAKKLPPEEQAKFKSLGDDYDLPRPFADDGKPRDFYPVSEGYSMVLGVPDDVRSDWLGVAYEAALALRDRSGGGHAEANREHGTAAVARLEARFPGLRHGRMSV